MNADKNEPDGSFPERTKCTKPRRPRPSAAGKRVSPRPAWLTERPAVRVRKDLAAFFEFFTPLHFCVARPFPAFIAPRRLAEGQLRRERPNHTLQPTALVHEAYVRMVGQEQAGYRDRAHFLAIAAHAMRKILIDHARGHYAAKRGGRLEKLAIDEERDGSVERPSILIALDDALGTLEGKDPLLARLVEMRYFGGLTAEESSAALNLEIKVVRRQLRLAEAWLQREMDQPAPGSQAAPTN
jgi:RNA polymerase sigma-70 factor (ECF subfamily)